MTRAETPSIPDLLRETAAEMGTHPAIIEGGDQLDFAAFDRVSDAVAAALVRRGIRKGDRVALYSINCAAFALAYAGIVKSGAIVVPINVLLHPEEVAWILGDSGATALIYHEALAPAVAAIRGTAPLRLVVAIGTSPPPAGDLGWREIVAESGPPPAVGFDPAADIAAILYTSGTTGKPKGAMLTHRNLVSNTRSIRRALHLEPRTDVLVVVLPMFHSFAATVGMLFPLLHGCSFVPLPRFDPELLARTIHATRATIFLGVPSMYSVLLRLPDEAVPLLASLRLCVSGGAALPVEVLRRFEARFGKPLIEGDGPTECSPVTCVNPPDGIRKVGSVGPPVPDVEMRILDDGGAELPRGGVGEICVRGPNVMKGYWNRPEETRESFHGEWFRTGDLGHEDEDGYFWIVDRKKDMVIVNGMNVYPRVVEEVLHRFEPVREAAVVGEPHELHGEIPVAYVALREGMRATAEEVRAFCRNHLGRHEVPRKVRFLAELPRNAAGKIVKRELRRAGELERGVKNREDAPGA